MKKKILSAVALTLACGMTLGVVGCSGEPEYNVADFSTAKTEEQIYQSVGYGYEQYNAYEGAMTVTINSVYTEDGGAEKDVETTVAKISIDPSTKKMYMTMNEKTEAYKGTEKVGENVETTVSKLYKEGENNYSYMKSTEKENGATEESVEEMYTKLSQAYVDSALANEEMISSMMEVDFDTFSQYLGADSFATIKNAYETVYAEQLTAKKATDENATASASVTATNTNGAIEFKVATATSTKMDVGGGMMADSYSIQDMAFTGKDGKLSKVYFKMDMGMTATVEDETMKEAFAMETTMDISYSFDGAGYDAITTSTPTDGVQEMPDIKQVALVLDINGVERKASASVYNPQATAQQAFDQLLNNYGLTSSSYQLKAYTDSAKTTALDLTDKTIDQLNAIGKVYLSIEANDGYASFVTYYETVDNKTDAYKIVFGDQSYKNFGYISSEWFNPVEGATNERQLDTDYDEIYVNGTKLAEGVTTVAYEDGGEYVVKYVRVRTNEDCDIFSMFF